MVQLEQGQEAHSLVVAPGSQKGCRRQAWHTAGWVGAGSQLGPERGCQARRARRRGFHHLCFEPCLQPRPGPPPALHAPAAAVAAAVALKSSLRSAPLGPPRFSVHGLAVPTGRVTRIPAAAASCACVSAKSKEGSAPRDNSRCR